MLNNVFKALCGDVDCNIHHASIWMTLVHQSDPRASFHMNISNGNQILILTG